MLVIKEGISRKILRSLEGQVLVTNSHRIQHDRLILGPRPLSHIGHTVHRMLIGKRHSSHQLVRIVKDQTIMTMDLIQEGQRIARQVKTRSSILLSKILQGRL